jgi:subtilisin family serine protease
MIDMSVRRVNIQGLLLSTMLAISMFAAIAPIAANLVENTVSVSAIQKLTTAVAESLKATTPEQLNIIIEAVDDAPVAARVKEIGGQVSQIYKSVEALAASVSASKIFELASDPNVVRIYADPLVAIKYNGAITENLKGDVPIDPVTGTPMLQTESPDVEAVPMEIADIASAEPSIYTNAYLTHADLAWSETDSGAGSTVAIIDTGVYSPSPMLVGNVIGGIDISSDVGTTWEGYNRPTNHYHGTACAHLLAAHATLIFRPTHPYGEAIYLYDPEGSWKNASGYIYVPCLGIAPAASIYGIKVFSHTGAGVPTSVIMQGIDIAIQMKLSGTMDIDVISMSLGGGVGADGEDPEDLLVDSATAAGITVVAAAGNEGPAPLRVASPGSAKTSIAVGAAMDPIHEHVWGDIYFDLYGGYPPGNGLGEVIWYPSEEKSIVDFSCRGPSADGRIKPEVVATGSWCFLGIFPNAAGQMTTLRMGGGTSFSCPQVAGEAALLNAYSEQNSLSIGPAEIKQAIYDGAEPIPGFTPMEQGAGYVNVVNSLNVIKSMSFGTIPSTWPHHICDFWFPPIDTMCIKNGKATVYNVVLEPAKYKYLNFWTSSQIDSIKVKLANVQLADPAQQNPYYGDAGVIYMSTPERGGIDEYLFYGLYVTGDGDVLVTSDVPFQPGVVRLVLAGDFSSYESVIIGELTIEVTEVMACAMSKTVVLYNNGIPVETKIEVYSGKIETFFGSVKEGETDTYSFNIPDANGYAYVFLYWWRDWAHWATSDLDLTIVKPDSTLNTDGATGASPETAMISGLGNYQLIVDGYQVYFGKTEYYCLQVVYIAEPAPLWSSSTFMLNRFASVKSPVYGVAMAKLHDTEFDTWYIGDFAYLTCWQPGICVGKSMCQDD